MSIVSVLQRGTDSLKKKIVLILFRYSITFENLSSGIFKILIFHFQIIFLSTTIDVEVIDSMNKVGKIICKFL